MVELTLTGVTAIGTHSSILPLIMIIGRKTNSLRRHSLVEIERGLEFSPVGLQNTLQNALQSFFWRGGRYVGCGILLTPVHLVRGNLNRAAAIEISSMNVERSHIDCAEKVKSTWQSTILCHMQEMRANK
jgi:hypothetical protein